jgi:hypothetical protein
VGRTVDEPAGVGADGAGLPPQTLAESIWRRLYRKIVDLDFVEMLKARLFEIYASWSHARRYLYRLNSPSIGKNGVERSRRHRLPLEARMRLIQYLIVLSATPLALISGPAYAQCSFPFTNLIYGVWKADDGGTCYMRQIGGDMWWLGESSDGGGGFTNVFHGQIQGNKVTGGWLDLPRDVAARRTNAGTVELLIDNPDRPTKLTKILPSPSGPAASIWRRSFPCSG